MQSFDTFLSNAAKLLCINLQFFAALLCLICTMCHVFPVSCICWAWHCITSQVDDAFGLGGFLCEEITEESQIFVENNTLDQLKEIN